MPAGRLLVPGGGVDAGNHDQSTSAGQGLRQNGQIQKLPVQDVGDTVVPTTEYQHTHTHTHIDHHQQGWRCGSLLHLPHGPRCLSVTVSPNLIIEGTPAFLEGKIYMMWTTRMNVNQYLKLPFKKKTFSTYYFCRNIFSLKVRISESETCSLSLNIAKVIPKLAK